MSQNLILLCRSDHFQLVNSQINYFTIFTIRKITFLLAKAEGNGRIQSQIGIQAEGNSYYCTFSRHVNLLYCNRLGKLLKSLHIHNISNLHNQWLLLYEIQNFYPKNDPQYFIQNPAYGEQVIVRGEQTFHTKIISNCFKQSGKCFYFIDNQYSNQPERMLGEILSVDMKWIYGLLIKIGNVNFCMPFHSILSDKGIEVKIARSIVENLNRTVYLSFEGNYCTGTMISDNRIISTRHLLPASAQNLNCQVNVRRYPYHISQKVVVVKIGSKNIDLIELLILNVRSQEQNLYYKEYEKPQTTTKLGDEIVALGFGKYSYQEQFFENTQIVLPTVVSGIISKMIKFNHLYVFFKTDANLYNGFSGCSIWQNNLHIGTAVFILKNKNTSTNYNRHNFSYGIEFIYRAFLFSKDFELPEQQKQLINFELIQTRKQLKIRSSL